MSSGSLPFSWKLNKNTKTHTHNHPKSKHKSRAWNYTVRIVLFYKEGIWKRETMQFPQATQLVSGGLRWQAKQPDSRVFFLDPLQYCFSVTYGRFVLNVFLSSAALSFHNLAASVCNSFCWWWGWGVGGSHDSANYPRNYFSWWKVLGSKKDHESKWQECLTEARSWGRNPRGGDI